MDRNEKRKKEDLMGSNPRARKELDEYKQTTAA